MHINSILAKFSTIVQKLKYYKPSGEKKVNYLLGFFFNVYANFHHNSSPRNKKKYLCFSKISEKLSYLHVYKFAEYIHICLNV